MPQNTFRKIRLFTHGPTPLLPATQFAMAATDLHRRTPEFRAMTRAGAPTLIMCLFALTAPAAAVTALLPPEGVDSGVIVKELKSRFGAAVTNGQGEMKGQIFRTAHLGFFDPLGTLALLGGLEQVNVDSLPASKFKLGDALTAAQKTLAGRSCATANR